MSNGNGNGNGGGEFFNQGFHKDLTDVDEVFLHLVNTLGTCETLSLGLFIGARLSELNPEWWGKFRSQCVNEMHEIIPTGDPSYDPVWLAEMLLKMTKGHPF